MNRKLFIHAGAPRTATSSIQAFIRTNAEALLAAGYLNPNRAGRNIGLANQIFAPSSDVGRIAAELNKIADNKHAHIHSIVISDEDICMRRDLSALRLLQQHFEVKFLFTLRRQDLWLESWYQQNVKWQWNPTLAHIDLHEFLELRDQFHWIHYDSLINNVLQYCDRKALVLRIFEKKEMPNGPIAAFCEDIGLPNLDRFKPVENLNASIDAMCSEFLRLLPLDEMPPQYRSLVERAAIELDRTRRTAMIESSPYLIDHCTRQQIMAEYDEGNNRTAKDFFTRPTLFLEPLPGADAPIAARTLPQDSYILMSTFVAPMIRNIIAEVAKSSAMTKRQ